MSETLEIPVRYKKQDLIFKAHTIRFGYVHHIVVDVNGTPITIERDEEGSYRALVDLEKLPSCRLDSGLIEAIVSVLESL
jgi:hypothetical protein